MKKILILLLAVCLAFALASCKKACDHVDADADGACDSCGAEVPVPCTHADENYDGACDSCNTAMEVKVMTYAEYMAAELNSHVVIEAYVQGHQSWWDNKVTVYLADEDGAYFAYEMVCSEEDAAKLEKGTKLRVYGFKSEWKGEVEITDCAFNFVEAEPYVAPAVDLTAKLGTNELINYQNQLAIFRALEVVSVEYKNGEPGDDVYLTLKQGENEYSFCVEVYLTGVGSDVYNTVGTLQAGDLVDVEAFVYWYDGMNPHVTSICKYMTHAEYEAAELNTEVRVISYVQGKQSWWDNKGTFYLQSPDGAVFAYEMAVTEEVYNALTVGTRVGVYGYKSEWKGEVEVMDGTIYPVGGDTYVAEPVDITDKLATDELISYQNQLVKFTDMTVKAFEYKNGEPGDDIYLTLTKGEADYSFCVEIYLTGTSTDLYKLFTQGILAVGDVIDVECFVYWYNGMNPHVVSITNINE
ncbi:MAG: hypothetical protein IKL79_01480 [Clostridia bacterium]|nr:hypothetical protein [Clostridia bacterium]